MDANGPDRLGLGILEDTVEAYVRSLPLLTVPSHRALVYLGTVFNEQSYSLTRTRDPSTTKFAFNHVVGWIMDYCQTDGETDCVVDVDAAEYGMANEALEFAFTYDWLLCAYRQYHRGRFQVKVRERDVQFLYPARYCLDRDILEWTLWRRKEAGRFDRFFSPQFKTIAARIEAASSIGAGQQLVYVPDPVVVEFARDSIQYNLRGFLPPEISNGAYTLGESNEVWQGLLTLGATREYHRIHIGLRETVNSAVMRESPEAFVALLEQYAPIRRERCLRVIEDLILPENGKRDLRAQPLIESQGRILFVPNLLLSLLWEPCTQALWARRYPGPFGREIAKYKSRLAEEFASACRRESVVVSAMRKLRDTSGVERGDADVAVYSPEERKLALFEVKWFNPGDDVLEVADTDKRLHEAVEQAWRAKQFVLENLGRAVPLLFPTSPRLPEPVIVNAFVIVRGALGSGFLGDTDPPVLSYDECLSVVSKSPSVQLSELLEEFVATLKPSRVGEARIAHDAREICGWRVRIPHIHYERTSPRAQVSRNQPCPCGSGRKFKRCCGR